MTVHERLTQQALLALGKRQHMLLDIMDRIQSTQSQYDKRLPKIVVAGSQSVGKSSLLAGLTNIPFETNADKCTRFATEIRLRWAAQESIKVTIIPDSEREPSDQARLERFEKVLDPSTSFSEIFKAAHNEITKGVQGFICRDRLIVIKSGPDQPLLTLVDLPGIVEVQSDGQSNDDIRAIEALADLYMKSSRTLILAVIGGNSDYVLSPILNKVKKFDPDGSRTIGVVTKPDYVNKARLEKKFIDLIMSRDSRNRLALGWYVMLNPGPDDNWPTPEVRSEKEREFFSAGAWTEVPESSWGAAALSEQLSVQLERHILNYLPSVREQAEEELESLEKEQKALCDGRETMADQRVYLIRKVNDSKIRAVQAVNGNYGNDTDKGFFPREPTENGEIPGQNLRSRTVDDNQNFANRLRAEGLGLGFTSDSSHFADLTDDMKQKKKEFANTVVAEFRRQFRGVELPEDRNPRIPYYLFRRHSEKHWGSLAKKHLQTVTENCNKTLGLIIDDVWPKHMRAPFKRYFLNEGWAVYQSKAKEELNNLLEDRKYELQTFDPEYVERFRKWYNARIAEDSDNLAGGNADHESELVLEQSLILYDIYAKIFINNVICQVIERHLMSGLEKVFDSSPMAKIPDEKVRAIMAESRETIERRKQVKIRIGDLQEALKAMDEIPFVDNSGIFVDEYDSDDDDFGGGLRSRADAYGEQTSSTPRPSRPGVVQPTRQPPPPPTTRQPNGRPQPSDIRTSPPDTNGVTSETSPSTPYAKHGTPIIPRKAAPRSKPPTPSTPVTNGTSPDTPSASSEETPPPNYSFRSSTQSPPPPDDIFGQQTLRRSSMDRPRMPYSYTNGNTNSVGGVPRMPQSAVEGDGMPGGWSQH